MFNMRKLGDFRFPPELSPASLTQPRDVSPLSPPSARFASAESPLRPHAPSTHVISIIIRACNSWKKKEKKKKDMTQSALILM